MHIYRERGGDAGTESGYALKMRELIVDLGSTLAEARNACYKAMDALIRW